MCFEFKGLMWTQTEGTREEKSRQKKTEQRTQKYRSTTQQAALCRPHQTKSTRSYNHSCIWIHYFTNKSSIYTHMIYIIYNLYGYHLQGSHVMWSKSWLRATSLHWPQLRNTQSTVSQNLKRAKEESPVLPVFVGVIGTTSMINAPWTSPFSIVGCKLAFYLIPPGWRTTRKLKLQCKFVWRRPPKELICFISQNSFWFSHLRGN